MEDKKVDKMRDLYKESDHLKTKLEFYQRQYAEEEEKAKEQYQKEH